jgi:hypothetical protein
MHPTPRPLFFILNLSALLALPSCAMFSPTPEIQQSTAVGFSVDVLTPEQRQLSLESTMKRFGEEHGFLVQKNCFRFIAQTGAEPYGESCFTLEPHAEGGLAVVHLRRSWQANLFLSGWYESMDELNPVQAIIDGLKDRMDAIQKHQEFQAFLSQYQIKRRIIDPYRLLTKQQKKLLLDTYTEVLDIAPDKFEQYAETQRYRKRWMLGADLPGAPRIKVFFATPFVEFGITSLFVQDHAELEALVRVVAYDYVPEQFAMQNADLSLSVTKQGQWRLENRSAEIVRIHRIGGRYHQADALLFGTLSQEDIDLAANAPMSIRGLLRAFLSEQEKTKAPAKPVAPEFMDLAPHAVLQMDVSQPEFARYHFPRNPFIGIKSWEQGVDFGYSIEYEVAGEKRILKRLERLVPEGK